MSAAKGYARYISVPEPERHTRMSSIEFTRSLTESPATYGVCHCVLESKAATREAGISSRAVFPEYGMRDDGKGTKIVGYHCLLCRCDEHTPQGHGRPTTEMPGCGRHCTRGTTDVLLTDEFPSFEEWVRTQGGAALRAEGKATPHTTFARTGAQR